MARKSGPKWLLIVLSVATLLGLVNFRTVAGQAAASPSPAALVTAFHETLLDVMKHADSLGYAGRYARLEPQVSSVFHLRLMTQITSGAHWRKAEEAQKSALVTAFSKVSIATYAARFDGFSGQSFKTLDTKSGPQGTRLVETRLLNPDGDDVALTYVTKQVEGDWRVIDVILDTGISELAVRRSEYRQVLKTGGIAALVKALNDKAAKLTNG